MYSIKKEVIGAFIEAAKHTFPQEFIGMLGGKKEEKIVDELIIVPAVFGDTFSTIQMHLVPFDPNYVGTAHSHPSHSNMPSRQDIKTFSKTGQIHLIACHPFDLNNLQAFNQKGENVKIKII